MVIRKETQSDYAQVYTLVKAAFAQADHADGNEQDLVVLLRKSPAFLPQLSLVAEEAGKIVGHILFTQVQIGESTQVALAPLAVLPEYQRQGIGTALIEEGHHIAASLGYGYSIVLGSSAYYPRMDYVPADTLGISCPFSGVPRENFMACRLQTEVPPIHGVVQYAQAFFQV